MDFLAIFKVFGLDAAAADGTILDSGQAPPLTPRDGISRKGKPLAPIRNLCLGYVIGIFVWALCLGSLFGILAWDNCLESFWDYVRIIWGSF